MTEKHVQFTHRLYPLLTGMSGVIVVNGLLRIVQVGLRFPTGLGVRVSLPLYQEHHAPTPSASRDLGINDRLYDVLFFVISQVSWYWWRRALVVEGRRVVRCKERLVEHVVNLPSVWDLKAICGCTDFFENLEGSVATIVKGL